MYKATCIHPDYGTQIALSDKLDTVMALCNRWTDACTVGAWQITNSAGDVVASFDWDIYNETDGEYC